MFYEFTGSDFFLHRMALQKSLLLGFSGKPAMHIKMIKLLGSLSFVLKLLQ
jgi:hypothetical protein